MKIRKRECQAFPNCKVEEKTNKPEIRYRSTTKLKLSEPHLPFPSATKIWHPCLFAGTRCKNSNFLSIFLFSNFWQICHDTPCTQSEGRWFPITPQALELRREEIQEITNISSLAQERQSTCRLRVFHMCRQYVTLRVHKRVISHVTFVLTCTVSTAAKHQLKPSSLTDPAVYSASCYADVK